MEPTPDYNSGWRRWLLIQPREVCVAIALRTALRVLPVLYKRIWVGEPEIACGPLSAAFRACALSWVSVKHSTGRTDVKYGDKLVAYAAIAEQELGKVDEDRDGARTWARNTVAKAITIAASPSREADGTKSVLQYASWAGDQISVADDYYYKDEKLCAYASGGCIWRAAVDDATFIGSGKVANELVTRPLWPHEVDDWVGWSELKSTLLGRNQSWEGWIDWYQNRSFP